MSDINTQIIESLSEPEISQFPDFCAAIHRLVEENKRLREALEPFAKAADIKLCGDWRDNERFAQTDVGHCLTFGHLRAARAALETKS